MPSGTNPKFGATPLEEDGAALTLATECGSELLMGDEAIPQRRADPLHRGWGLSDGAELLSGNNTDLVGNAKVLGVSGAPGARS